MEDGDRRRRGPGAQLGESAGGIVAHRQRPATEHAAQADEEWKAVLAREREGGIGVRQRQRGFTPALVQPGGEAVRPGDAVGRRGGAARGQAAAWYLSAAKLGNRLAMHNLGVAYANGNGVRQSYEDAAHWFQAAADLGLVASQFNLGVLYERGFGVPASLEQAYEWYAIAAAIPPLVNGQS